MLTLIFHIISFVLRVNLLVVALLVFLLLLPPFLFLLVIGLSVLCPNPLCLLLSSTRILSLLLRKSLFINFL